MYCMFIVREAFAQFYYFFDIQNSKILHKTDISIPTHSLYHRTASEKAGVGGTGSVSTQEAIFHTKIPPVFEKSRYHKLAMMQQL